MDSYIENISNNTIRKQDYLLANSYEISEFSPEDLGEITGGIVAIIAMTGAGKTVLLKDLLSKTYKNYDKIYLFSRTAKLQSAYDFVPRSFITDDFDEQKLSDIWDFQTNKNEKNEKMENILVILDDIIASPAYKKSKMIDEIAYGARHCNITLIILSQNFTSIRLSVRNNIRIAICFQMQNKKEREKFADQFLGADSSKAGDLLLRRITDVKYQCLIVQVYKNGETLSNKVKKYIADPSVKIKLVDPDKKKERKTIVENSLELVNEDESGRSSYTRRKLKF